MHIHKKRHRHKKDFQNNINSVIVEKRIIQNSVFLCTNVHKSPPI